MMSRVLFFIALATLSCTSLAFSEGEPVKGNAIVHNVVDGDTFDLYVESWDTFNQIAKEAPGKASEHLDEVNKSMRVRLASVDTAESVHPDESQNSREGKQVSRAVRQKLEDRRVGFTCHDFGHYGRVICHIESDNQDLGLWLLENDMAQYQTQYGNDPYFHQEYESAR